MEFQNSEPLHTEIGAVSTRSGHSGTPAAIAAGQGLLAHQRVVDKTKTICLII